MNSRSTTTTIVRLPKICISYYCPPRFALLPYAMNRLRAVSPWPAGSPDDDGPFHPRDGTWFPGIFHRPFHPPNYDDWLDHNPDDYRDRKWPAWMINPLTGLPPRNLQGNEYTPGRWRASNGSGGPGHLMRWNEKPLPHAHGKKRRNAWVWPSDGKHKRSWGRWKDIIEGKGPDIFITKHGDRPSRNQWKNNFQDATPEDPGFNTHIDMPWATRTRPYDFRERRYRRPKGPNDIFWSDATWPSKAADHYKQPINYRCAHGDWFNMTWSPFGGVPMEGYNGVPLRHRGIFA